MNHPSDAAPSEQQQQQVNAKKRPAVTSPSPNSKRRLRDISLRVCRTVQQQGRTTFSRVADAFDDSYRRRVYDCLNVLLGTGLLDRSDEDSTLIQWRGYHVARDQRPLLRRRIQEALTQVQCWRSVVEMNTSTTSHVTPTHTTLPLPFVVVQTDPSTVVQCRMSDTLDSVAFDLTRPFVLHDDMAVMQAMGLHKTDVATLETWLPRDFVVYCYQHGLLDHMVEKVA